ASRSAAWSSGDNAGGSASVSGGGANSDVSAGGGCGSGSATATADAPKRAASASTGVVRTPVVIRCRNRDFMVRSAAFQKRPRCRRDGGGAAERRRPQWHPIAASL